MSNYQHVPESLASNTKRDGVNIAVSAAAVAVAAAVKMMEYGPAVQASRGTVARSDLLYDYEKDKRHSCVKVHLDGGPTARTPPSAASHPGEVVVTECLHPSRTVC